MNALLNAFKPMTEAPLVLVSWDGGARPLEMIHIDTSPQFRFILFDYTGTRTEGELLVGGVPCQVLSAKTECKGDIYQALSAHLSEQATWPEYVALIDDDILLSVSDINALIHVARCAGLDSFSPVLTHDCHWGHRWTLQQGHALLLHVDWIEVMMPFYRTTLFMAASPLYKGMVSSYGIDKYVMATAQKLTGMENAALVNRVAASHMRPITSGGKRFRNGLTAAEEREILKARCIELVHQQRPDLVRGAWYRRTFEQRHVRTLRERILAGLGRPLRRWLEQST
jgi:hypothetical protein